MSRYECLICGTVVETSGAAPLCVFDGGLDMPNGCPGGHMNKIVLVQKIRTFVAVKDGGAKLSFDDFPYDVVVSHDYMVHRWRATPECQGYYVQYDNGYESWSPTKAFEEDSSPHETDPKSNERFMVTATEDDVPHDTDPDAGAPSYYEQDPHLEVDQSGKGAEVWLNLSKGSWDIMLGSGDNVSDAFFEAFQRLSALAAEAVRNSLIVAPEPVPPCDEPAPNTVSEGDYTRLNYGCPLVDGARQIGWGLQTDGWMPGCVLVVGQKIVIANLGLLTVADVCRPDLAGKMNVKVYEEIAPLQCVNNAMILVSP